MIYSLLLTLTALIYVLFLARVLRGLKILRKTPHKNIKWFPTVSVVIAARNEEKHIAATLDSLLAQSYLTAKWDIIVVDDRSDDGTNEIINRYVDSSSRIRSIKQTEVQPGLSPKKQALALGIAQSSSDIILTTDADCTVPYNWIDSFVELINEGADMAVGQARFNVDHNAPLWQQLQALDYQSQSYVSVGLIAAGAPFTCTGASLAYRKDLYDRIEGWKGSEALISGDDELLMAKADRAGAKITASAMSESIVKTAPPENLREFWHQRVRWASKGLYYRSSRKWTLAGIFVFYVLLLIGLVGFLREGINIPWLLCFHLKLILDWKVLKAGARVYGEETRFFHYVVLEIIHLPLIVLLPIFGHFGRFKWKGTVYRSKAEA